MSHLCLTLTAGVIAGAVVGSVLLLAAIAALTLFLIHRRRKAAGQGGLFKSGAANPNAAAPAALEPPAIAGGRKLKLIGRRSNGTEDGEGSGAGSSTPHSTAGPVAEAVLTPSNGGCSSGSNGGSSSGGGGIGGHGSVLLMNTNPLYGSPQSPRPSAGAVEANGVRSSAGNLRDLM